MTSAGFGRRKDEDSFPVIGDNHSFPGGCFLFPRIEAFSPFLTDWFWTLRSVPSIKISLASGNSRKNSSTEVICRLGVPVFFRGHG